MEFEGSVFILPALALVIVHWRLSANKISEPKPLGKISLLLLNRNKSRKVNKQMSMVAVLASSIMLLCPQSSLPGNMTTTNTRSVHDIVLV